MRFAAPAVVILLSSVLIVALGAGARPDDALVAAVYPPWWSDARIGRAAAGAGDIAAAGAARNVILIRGEPRHLSDRARRSGALLLVGAAAARLCADPNALET